MRLFVLILTMLAVAVSLRWMAVFMWRARGALRGNIMALAVALSSGSIVLFGFLMLFDVVFGLGRWTVHVVADIVFLVMFSAWDRISNNLFRVGKLQREESAE